MAIAPEQTSVRRARIRPPSVVAVAVAAAILVAVLSVPMPALPIGLQAGTSVPAASADDRSGTRRPTERDRAEAECLAGERPVELVPDQPVLPWPPPGLGLADATAIDARGQVLDNSELNRSGFGLAMKIHPSEGRKDLCLVGGTLRTGLDPEATSWNTWHRVTALTVEKPGFTVVGTEFFNQGDLMAFVGNAGDWRVVGVRVDGGDTHPGGYAHDDCIENDSMHSGLVADSKFDGCFAFISATHASERRVGEPGERVVIRDTLVRLQPYRNSFNVPKYGENGHSGFFKWARTDSAIMVPPAISVSDSVFRADTPARYGGNENGFLGLPPGSTCERVTLVGTEAWPPDELESWRDQCTDLRLGAAADWDAAVATWEADHPPMRDLRGQGQRQMAAALGW